MTENGWSRAVSNWLSHVKAWSNRSPKLLCADCPIVMSCGLEPRENCLPRLEALARGSRWQVGPWDTGTTDRTMQAAPWMRVR